MKEELDFLDELLKEKVDDAVLPFKEEYWDNMSAKLDAEEKGKKRGFPYWRGLSVFFLLLTTAIGAYIVPKYLTKKTIAKTEKIAQYSQAEQSMIAQNTPTNSSENNTNDTNNKQNINNLNENNSSDNLNSNQPLSNETSTEKSEKSSSNVNKSNATPEETKSNKAKPSNKQVKEITEKQSEAKKTENLAATVESNTKAGQPLASQNTPISKTKNKETHAKSVHSGRKANKANQEKMEKNEAIVQKGSDEPSPVVVLNSRPPATESSNKPVIEIKGKTYEVKNKEVERTRRTPDVEESNPRYVAGLGNYVPQVDCTIIYTLQPQQQDKAVASIKTDSAASSIKEPTVAKEPLDFEKRLLLFATIGMNLNKGLRGNAEDQQSWGVSPYIGLGFEKPVKHDLSIAATLGFTYFNGLNMVKRDNIYTYSFGVDSTEQSLYTRKLFQFYVPLTVQYKLLERHFLFGGLGVTYSFQTSGKLEEKTYSTQVNTMSPAYKSSTNTSLVSEFNKGFQTFDFFLQAGYSYNFMERWSAQIMLQQGFMDISKNSYYNNNVRNNLTRVSVGLKLNLKRYGK